jgi:hypothetical protein
MVSASVTHWKKILDIKSHSLSDQQIHIPVLQIYGTFLKNPSAAIF